MRILWTYLQPHWRLGLLALLFAAIAQVLALVDPIIFGRIIDHVTQRQPGAPDPMPYVMRLLGLAVLVAVLSRLAKALQKYVTRLVVQKLGVAIFNDGLRHLMRLRFQEFED